MDPAVSLAGDARWMHMALTLAARSLGRVAPNPAVGAVLVQGGRVLGRGATADGGRPHAISKARSIRPDSLCSSERSRPAKLSATASTKESLRRTRACWAVSVSLRAGVRELGSAQSSASKKGSGALRTI